MILYLKSEVDNFITKSIVIDQVIYSSIIFKVNDIGIIMYLIYLSNF